MNRQHRTEVNEVNSWLRIMWFRKPATAELVSTICELVFMNQHKNLTESKMVSLMPLFDAYTVLDGLAAARDEGLIFCSNGRWGVRAKYLQMRVK